MTDDFRHEFASTYGGFELQDMTQQSVLRSAIGEILSVRFLLLVKIFLTEASLKVYLTLLSC